MSNWDSRYRDRVQLLVEMLPVLDREPRFALKGGTAINLFEHDLPRLSVDIDLTWLPTQDFDTDTAQIAEALAAIAARLAASHLGMQVRTSAAVGARTLTRLIASRGRAQVQVETGRDARNRASGAAHGPLPRRGTALWLGPDAGTELRGSVCRQAGSGFVPPAPTRLVRHRGAS